jgi:hypothetical protein
MALNTFLKKEPPAANLTYILVQARIAATKEKPKRAEIPLLKAENAAHL